MAKELEGKEVQVVLPSRRVEEIARDRDVGRDPPDVDPGPAEDDRGGLDVLAELRFLGILEERADIQPAAVDGFDLLEIRTFGDTRMHFYRYRSG